MQLIIVLNFPNKNKRLRPQVVCQKEGRRKPFFNFLGRHSSLIGFSSGLGVFQMPAEHKALKLIVIKYAKNHYCHSINYDG